jgi:hypothetical protein
VCLAAWLWALWASWMIPFEIVVLEWYITRRGCVYILGIFTMCISVYFAHRRNMPTCYSVCGEEYASKAALQREWRERCRRYHRPGRANASNEDTIWFITAAFASGTHRKFLFECNTDDLSKCLQANKVHIDQAGTSFGPGGLSNRFVVKASKHMRRVRCVFVVSASDPTKMHTVPSNLGDSQGQQKKIATLGWLRQAIQGQIDTYRGKRKMQASLVESTTHRPYNCEICKKSCRRKENHIDHGIGDDSFKAILKRFQTECLLRPVTSEDGEDRAIRSRWQKYHQRNARLSLTCKTCNLANK